MFPLLLTPTTTYEFQLPTTGLVQIRKVTPRFIDWSGEEPPKKYGKKLLLYEGRLAFAELVVLWAMQSVGWEGVWIDSYQGEKYRTGYWDSEPLTELPPEPTSMLSRIRDASGLKTGGAWDVFCWRGSEVVFAECKRKKKDSIKENQIRWLQAAINVGVPLESFLIVEWTSAETD